MPSTSPPTYIYYALFGAFMAGVLAWVYAGLRVRHGSGIKSTWLTALVGFLLFYPKLVIDDLLVFGYPLVMEAVLVPYCLAESCIVALCAAWVYDRITGKVSAGA